LPTTFATAKQVVGELLHETEFVLSEERLDVAHDAGTTADPDRVTAIGGYSPALPSPSLGLEGPTSTARVATAA